MIQMMKITFLLVKCAKKVISSFLVIPFICMGSFDSFSICPQQYACCVADIYSSHKKDFFKIWVEVAQKEEEKMCGAMWRTKFSAVAQGLYFIFKEGENPVMWMKNTCLALDIIFIDSLGCIVCMSKNTKPYSTALISCDAPFKDVVEFPSGFLEKNHLSLGDRILLSCLTP